MSGETSRALVLEEFGTLPRLVQRPVPVREPGQTLVRVRAAQVGHLDLNVVDGKFGIPPRARESLLCRRAARVSEPGDRS
ncbi:hypothetical protein [Streptomyces sp. NBC_00286]|uniref:hypothetical protein n=1 Tax=Streptomyces sp. NBC_00286 TaxID=2975701 RepID=UPI002E2ABE5D|nr:hypothetical protein [Streptomyces sp. NBC_00286]